MAPSQSLTVYRLGTVAYGAALRLQETLAAARRAGEVGDVLLLLQHPPVYTVGKRRTLHNVLADAPTLRRLGATVCHVGRGGDVTFHGPGQAVLYPILHLRALGLGARRYVEGLEDVMVGVAARHGVAARGRLPRAAGVWVGDRKLGAVGVQISAGVAMHGLALNVDTDLKFFEHIVPCGFADKSVTSLAEECRRASGPPVAASAVDDQLVAGFCEVYGYGDVRSGDVRGLEGVLRA